MRRGLLRTVICWVSHTGFITSFCFQFSLAKLRAWLQTQQWWLVGWSVHHFGLDWNISTTFERIFVKSGTEIHSSQRIKVNDFCDSLAFYLEPPAGQSFCLASEVSQDVQTFVYFSQVFFKTHSIFPIITTYYLKPVQFSSESNYTNPFDMFVTP